LKLRVRFRGVHGIVLVVVLALLGGGYAWYEHFAPAARLGKACGGLLPVDDMLAATGATSRFGGRDLRLSSHPFDGSASVSEPEGLPVTCRANGIVVAVETSADNDKPFLSDNASAEDENGSALPVPLGQGWSGYLTEEDGRVTVSVLLDCENWGPERGSGVLVSLDASVDGIGGAERARFARIATRTAAKAAGKAECDAAPGSRIERAEGTSVVSRVRVSQARGTCAGTGSQATVTETPARTSPVEACLLGNALRLTAAYGPFGNVDHVNGRGPYAGFDEPAGGEGLVVWATATCAGAQGTALYTATPARGSNRSFVSRPLTGREHADLKRFATRSAARQHCGTPVLP
jgi:hypothetical protein